MDGSPKRLGQLGWLVLPPILVVGFARIVSVGVGWLSEADALTPAVIHALPLLSAVPPLLLLLIATVAPRHRPVWTDGRPLSDVAAGIGLAIASVAIFVGSLTGLQALGVSGPDLSRFTWDQHLYFGTIGALIPALCEEVYFRSFLFSRLDDLRAPWIVGLSALSFASWHLTSPPYLLHTYLMGVLLGVAYHRTRRLLPVFVGHLLANMSAAVLFSTGAL